MATKMLRMGRKKSTGGPHKTPRTSVQIPTAWLAVARKLAAASKQPTMWYLLDLVGQKAKEAGLPIPPLPWEESDASPQ